MVWMEKKISHVQISSAVFFIMCQYWWMVGEHVNKIPFINIDPLFPRKSKLASCISKSHIFPMKYSKRNLAMHSHKVLSMLWFGQFNHQGTGWLCGTVLNSWPIGCKLYPGSQQFGGSVSSILLILAELYGLSYLALGNFFITLNSATK